MIVDCHSCGATYNISDDKVRGRRVRVRCKTCGEGIIVDGASLDDATRVYSPQFEPGAYSEEKDESTRVMSASGMEWREPGADDWTVNLSDTEQRTMSIQDIVSGYNSGILGDDAYVWRDGMSDWLPLREVPEINAALDSGESTRVMSQAALRAAAGPPPSSAPTQPGPIAPPPAAWPPQQRTAGARGVTAPTPVTYAAPVAPPRAVRTEPPPAATVEYAPSRPQAAPRAAAPARVRESRARADLFGGQADAHAEDELLRSSSVPLEQYDEKPTGARNENSVLFSLNTLKAGAPRGGQQSAPPRMLTASPQTAADILGMTAGGALAGMDSTAALLSAPRVDAPVPPPPAAVPVRDRMDTTPPTMRGKTSIVVVAAVLVLALGVAGGAFVVLRSRLATNPAAASAAAASAAPVTTTVSGTPTTPVATSATAPTEPAAPPAQEAPSPPQQVTAAPPPTAAAPPAPVTPPTKTAPAGGSGQQALKAALRPEKPEPAPAAEKGADKKVVLEEEPAAAEEEAPKPPFDTGAAKTALASAAASAAGCKKPDGPTGAGKVQVTFSTSGRATSANVIEGAFGGTPVGGCIAKAFRAAHVPAFSGDPVTVSKSFTVPE